MPAPFRQCLALHQRDSAQIVRQDRGRQVVRRNALSAMLGLGHFRMQQTVQTVLLVPFLVLLELHLCCNARLVKLVRGLQQDRVNV